MIAHQHQDYDQLIVQLHVFAVIAGVVMTLSGTHESEHVQFVSMWRLT